MFSGTWPVERPRPALSKRMTSRPTASGSVTVGSQLYKVPVKCWRHISGRPLPFPMRRQAYFSSLVSMNCVGAVVLLALAMAYLPSVVVGVAFRSPCERGALGSAPPLQHSAMPPQIRDLAMVSLCQTPLALILLRTVLSQ